MNKVLTLLILAVALAILKAALVALVLGLTLLLTYAFLTRPQQTLAFLATLTVMGLAMAKPLAFISASAAMAVAVVLVGSCGRREKPLLFADPDDGAQTSREARDPS